MIQCNPIWILDYSSYSVPRIETRFSSKSVLRQFLGFKLDSVLIWILGFWFDAVPIGILGYNSDSVPKIPIRFSSSSVLRIQFLKFRFDTVHWDPKIQFRFGVWDSDSMQFQFGSLNSVSRLQIRYIRIIKNRSVLVPRIQILFSS